jgi:hypothetical protein
MYWALLSCSAIWPAPLHSKSQGGLGVVAESAVFGQKGLDRFAKGGFASATPTGWAAGLEELQNRKRQIRRAAKTSSMKIRTRNGALGNVKVTDLAGEPRAPNEDYTPRCDSRPGLGFNA